MDGKYAIPASYISCYTLPCFNSWYLLGYCSESQSVNINKYSVVKRDLVFEYVVFYCVNFARNNILCTKGLIALYIVDIS